MSKVYKCRVKQDVSVSVAAEESITYQQRVSDLLPRDEMNALLRKTWEAEGAKAADGGNLELEIDEVSLEIDVDARIVVARGGERGVIARSFDGEASGYSLRDDERQAQLDAENKVRKQLEQEVEDERRRIEEVVERRLGRAAESIRELLRRVRGATEKDAAIRRAEQLGKVLGVSEDHDATSGTHRVVIQLEIPD
jgi:hypothetical protein